MTTNNDKQPLPTRVPDSPIDDSILDLSFEDEHTTTVQKSEPITIDISMEPDTEPEVLDVSMEPDTESEMLVELKTRKHSRKNKRPRRIDVTDRVEQTSSVETEMQMSIPESSGMNNSAIDYGDYVYESDEEEDELLNESHRFLMPDQYELHSIFPRCHIRSDFAICRRDNDRDKYTAIVRRLAFIGYQIIIMRDWSMQLIRGKYTIKELEGYEADLKKLSGELFSTEFAKTLLLEHEKDLQQPETGEELDLHTRRKTFKHEQWGVDLIALITTQSPIGRVTIDEGCQCKPCVRFTTQSPVGRVTIDEGCQCRPCVVLSLIDIDVINDEDCNKIIRRSPGEHDGCKTTGCINFFPPKDDILSTPLNIKILPDIETLRNVHIPPDIENPADIELPSRCAATIAYNFHRTEDELLYTIRDCRDPFDEGTICKSSPRRYIASVVDDVTETYVVRKNLNILGKMVNQQWYPPEISSSSHGKALHKKWCPEGTSSSHDVIR